MRKILGVGAAIVIAIITAGTAHAQTEHYMPGSFNIRDFVLPGPGFYAGVYNYGYSTNDLRDASGNQINSITIQGPGGHLSTTLNLSVHVNLYALAPAFIWVPKKKILGAKYGVMVVPTFANASLGGLLSRAEGVGQSVTAAQFNIGDTYVAPLWLDWTGKKYDIVANYGFYIPNGKYTVQNFDVPVVGPVRVASADNIGLGFWENQIQGAVYLYPWADKRMAIENAITWEGNRRKRGFDLTPGQYLTWNWGISEYLPLKKDMSLLAEVGPAGYGSFQTSDDTGSDANNPTAHDKVWAVGLQAGLTIPKRMMALNLHWFQEYSAVNRFQGRVLGISFVFKL